MLDQRVIPALSQSVHQRQYRILQEVAANDLVPRKPVPVLREPGHVLRESGFVPREPGSVLREPGQA